MFKNQLYELINQQPAEDINKILHDLASMLCATLYLNGQGEKMKEELLKNLGEIWDETVKKIGDKSEDIKLPPTQ